MTVTDPANPAADPSTKLRVIGFLDSSIDSVPTRDDLFEVVLQLSRPLTRFEQHFVDNADDYGEKLLTVAAGDDTTVVGMNVNDINNGIERVNRILGKIEDFGTVQTTKHDRITGSARETLKLINFD